MLSLAACAWLYSENRSLSQELTRARQSAAPPPTERAAPAPAPEPVADAVTAGPATDSTAEPEKTEPRGPALGARSERPSLTPTESAKEETRQERRKRRMAGVTAMFGRLDGETVEEYRERMVPFIENALSTPRERVEDARQAAEEAAGVNTEQRAELDEVFNDAYAEALALTNRAIEAGDLSPYQRNWAGVMNVTGGLGAVLQGTEARIGEILSTEQLQTIYDQGFEWGEYLGAKVPWEQLNPPPPPPGG